MRWLDRPRRRRTSPILLRCGRVLTPVSRLRYRVLRVRTGHSLLGDDELLPALLAVRIVSLAPLLALDLLSWPLARASVARPPWWLVEVRFDGPDAEFVRVASAPTKDEARRRRDQLASPR